MGSKKYPYWYICRADTDGFLMSFSFVDVVYGGSWVSDRSSAAQFPTRQLAMAVASTLRSCTVVRVFRKKARRG